MGIKTERKRKRIGAIKNLREITNLVYIAPPTLFIMETQIEYLTRLGLLESGTKEQIQEAKKTYRKIYQKWIKAQYKCTKRRVEFSLSRSEEQFLNPKAEQHGMKLPQFMKDSALCYNRQEYLLPSNSAVFALETGILRQGNNINQVALGKNIHGLSTDDDIRAIRYHLNQQEKIISKAFREPENLLDIVEERFSNPHFLQALKQRIFNYERTHVC